MERVYLQFGPFTVTFLKLFMSFGWKSSQRTDRQCSHYDSFSTS